jgi:hypothetical protein
MTFNTRMGMAAAAVGRRTSISDAIEPLGTEHQDGADAAGLEVVDRELQQQPQHPDAAVRTARRPTPRRRRA